jgi:hypothetical protein
LRKTKNIKNDKKQQKQQQLWSLSLEQSLLLQKKNKFELTFQLCFFEQFSGIEESVSANNIKIALL